MERFEMPRVVANLPDYAKLIPPNPVHETNDLLEGVADVLGRQSVVLGELVELAKDERAARVSAERSTRRWQWATFLLGFVTLCVGVVAVVLGAVA